MSEQANPQPTGRTRPRGAAPGAQAAGRLDAQPGGSGGRGILVERQHHPELADALYEKVFDARGGRFTLTVLRHYADRGHIDPDLVTPVVADVGEALVFKYHGDTGHPPDDEQLAAIVDQAILPVVGILPNRKKNRETG